MTGNKVSNPAHDGLLSRLGGNTQSETSAAWCSPNVVIAWNDSGSYLESYYFGGGGITNGFSFNGYAQSSNNGTTYVDQGYLNTSNPDYFLEGDPVVDCTDQNTFYQASLMGDYDLNNTTIAVAKSTNGGVDFADPVQAAIKPLAGHFLDKEWMAADPANPSNIYVSYTDFDSSGTICGSTTSGSPVFRQAIEFVRSTDGGATWSAPQELSTYAQGCEPNGNSGSYIDVGPGGEVYVAWLHFPADNPNNEILLRKSTDGGATFSAAVEVTQVMPMGAFDGVRQVLQGKVRFNQFPHLAVDRSTGPRAGTVYVTWADGRYQSRLEEVAVGEDLYHFGDIFVAKSTDGGATFQQTSVRVNNSIEPPGTDQFFPGITVDRAGITTTCFYDNKATTNIQNFLWGRTCATSNNGGVTWANLNRGATKYPGMRNQDVFINTRYQGDYDGLASDNRNLLGGFRGGFSDHARGNQDVRQNR